MSDSNGAQEGDVNVLATYEHRFRFLGYGSLKSPLWFIGIEEGLPKGKSLTSKEPCKHSTLVLPTGLHCYDPHLPVAEGVESSVWRICREVAKQAGSEGHYFMSNMAPLPRNAMAMRHPDLDEDAYRKQIIDQRIPTLAALIQKFLPRAVVFHGRSAWKQYRVREKFGITLSEDRIQSCQEGRLVFTNFFSRRYGLFGPQDQQSLVNLLTDWNVATGE